MKKTLLFVVILFSVTFLQAQERSLVTVTGKGVVKVEPDEVVIKSRIEHEGPSASSVKKQNDEVVSNIISYLKSKGIEEENFQTQYVNLNKNYDYNDKSYSYVANQSISITLKDISEYEMIMKGLLENGLNRIYGIQFQSSDMEKYEEEARKMAVLDAQSKARQLANPLDQSIGAAVTISESDVRNVQPLYRMDAAMASDAGNAEQSIAPGEMEITIQVTIGFELK